MFSDQKIRIQKIQARLKKEGVCGVLLSTPINIFYLLERVVDGYCFVPTGGNPLFFIRKPIGLTDEKTIFSIHKLEQIPELLKDNGCVIDDSLMLELDELSVVSYLRIKQAFSLSVIPKDATKMMREIRSIKTDREIQLLKESARVQSEIFALVPSFFESGMTDRELSVRFESEMRLRNTAPQLSTFKDLKAGLCCVWTGDNASVPSPYDFSLGGAGHIALPLGDIGMKIEKGMSIMIDCGVNITGYVSDMTRCFSYGKLSEEAYRIHQVSLDIMQMVREAKIGDSCEELYLRSLRMAESAGLKEHYMGYKQQAKFLGHGVGLVVNELPVLCRHSMSCLEKNMVIAAEPKFIVLGVGAVGCENTFVVTEQGLNQLTFGEEKIIEL